MKVEELIQILQEQDPKAVLVTDKDTGYDLVMPDEVILIDEECFPVEIECVDTTYYDVTNKSQKYKQKVQIIKGFYIGGKLSKETSK